MKTKVLITGGCGFVGSSLALMAQAKYPNWDIICFDNLRRRGSELNIPRIRQAGIEFIHGDIRLSSDLAQLPGFDVLIDASAEPSVLAGIEGSVDYVVDTNLGGTINCLNLARKFKAQFVFLSTSRVYPIQALENIRYEERESRLEISDRQQIPGISTAGISEEFPLEGYRSLYGASKLASELMIQEFNHLFDVKTIVNRCGVITGPWQMGKVDQGVVVLWAARHFWQLPLKYIGYGGTGKQVRDVLHVEDLFRLVDYQIQNADSINGQTYNVGGGAANSLSLLELTSICREIVGRETEIGAEQQNRPADIPIYISDNHKIGVDAGWKPEISTQEIVQDVFSWINKNEIALKPILAH